MITYRGSRSISGNPILRQYELEDITSRFLFETGYNPRQSLKVDAEAFARHIGVNVQAAYLSDNPYSLCAVAFDEQTLRTEKGNYRMRYGDALVELAILDRGRQAAVRLRRRARGCAFLSAFARIEGGAAVVRSDRNGE